MKRIVKLFTSHYGIRKLTIGVGSVLLIGSFLVGGQAVFANEVTTEPEPSVIVSTPTEGELDTSVEELPNYNGTIAFVGQWTGESSRKEDSSRSFTSADETLGAPLANAGLFRGVAKTFLGWSDQPPVDGQIAPGARLFSSVDTLATAFPNGLPSGATLYGVYASLNDPDEPFPTNRFAMGFAIINGMSTFEINTNTVAIDEHVSSEDVLPNTTLAEDKIEDTSRTVIDNYNKENNDTDQVNEVVLSSEFTMNNNVAMLVYKNPNVGYVGPVLSNTYEKNDFSTEEGATGYTYVDLSVNLDEGLTLPEKLFLEFDGYSWRPLYVIGVTGETRETLNIISPLSEANLGNTKDSMTTLVDNLNPKVTFGVEPKGYHNLIVRMILRHGEAERIKESDIVADEGKSIAETIIRNMTLKALTSSDLQQLFPAKTTAEISALIIRIAQMKAKELARTQGVETLKVNGWVAGNVTANAGRIGSGLFSLDSLTNLPIEKVDSNTVALGYTESYNITFEFVSKTLDRTLPQEIMRQMPTDQLNVADRTNVDLPMYNEVIENSGRWTFKGWNLSKVGNIIEDKATVDEEDLHLIGVWEYVANAGLTPIPEPESTPGLTPIPEPESTPGLTPILEPAPQPQFPPVLSPSLPVDSTSSVVSVIPNEGEQTPVILPQTGSEASSWSIWGLLLLLSSLFICKGKRLKKAR